MNNRLLRTGLGLGAALVTVAAHGDDLHYNNMLVGERAMGMGGAYTAVSDDPGGLYYNPAGIVYGRGSSLSASGNAYHQTQTTYSNVIGGSSWTRSASSLVPNFFGVIQPLGDGYTGFSYAMPDSLEENQSQQFNNFGDIERFVININNRDRTYKMGPSYAWKVNDSLALGATLYFHYRKYDSINNQWIREKDGTYEWSNLYYDSSEWGVNPVLGLMWSPLDKVSVGLTVRETVIAQANTDVQSTCASDVPNNAAALCLPSATYGNPKNPVRQSSNQKRDLPVNTRLGIAYFPSDRLLLSTDVSYYEGTQDFTLKREPTWNAAVGAEYYLDNQLALRTGLYTNRANTPKIAYGKTDQAEHLDYNGASLSLSRFTRNSTMTVGVNYQKAKGKAQVFRGSPSIQDARSQSLTVFLATSYSY